MGMFDKDKAIGLLLHETLPQNQKFILWDARVLDETINTEFGPAEVAELEVSTMDDPRERMSVTTVASAIVAKVKEAEASDFPAVVVWTKTDTKTRTDVTILKFIRPLNQAPAHTPGPDPQAEQV